jgi:hypothetical protein
MPDYASPLYKVVYSNYQIRTIRTLGEIAADHGLRAAYLTAVRSMHYHMETDRMALT